MNHLEDKELWIGKVNLLSVSSFHHVEDKYHPMQWMRNDKLEDTNPLLQAMRSQNSEDIEPLLRERTDPNGVPLAFMSQNAICLLRFGLVFGYKTFLRSDG